MKAKSNPLFSSIESEEGVNRSEGFRPTPVWQTGLDVLLVDPAEHRREVVTGSVVEAGGRAHVAETPVLKDLRESPTACRIALVALGSSFDHGAPVLEWIVSLS